MTIQYRLSETEVYFRNKKIGHAKKFGGGKSAKAKPEHWVFFLNAPAKMTMKLKRRFRLSHSPNTALCPNCKGRLSQRRKR